MSAGAVCTATCGEGLNPTGDASYTCGPDGQWYGGCGFSCTSWAVRESFEYIYSLDFAPGKVTFDEAQSLCEGVNSNLASVATREENEFIFQLTGSDLNNPKWLGGKRNRSGSSISPFTWYWIDGTPYTVQEEYEGCDPTENCLWGTGEPNDLTGNENCIQMGASDLIAVVPAAWNDAMCSANRQFVCKRPVPAADSGALCDSVPTTAWHCASSTSSPCCTASLHNSSTAFSCCLSLVSCVDGTATV